MILAPPQKKTREAQQKEKFFRLKIPIVQQLGVKIVPFMIKE